MPGWTSQLRKSSKGANLALIVVILSVLIGMMGVGIYAGLQAYLRNEIQKAATTASMAGAAQYYVGGPGGAAQTGVAQSVARQVFNDILANTPALRAFDTRLTNVLTSNGRVTVEVQGTMPTPFLTFAGIREIKVNGEATSQNLIYPPTYAAGVVTLTPPTTRHAFLLLEFPLVDIPGIDVSVQTPPTFGANGYTVKACNQQTCYDLMAGASGDVRTVSGVRACFKNCSFDLAAAGVKKATELRFVDDGVWSEFSSDGTRHLNTVPPTVVPGHVQLYGYAGSCASRTRCAVPRGFIAHP